MDDPNVRTLNAAGEWVPVIPLPYFYGFALRRCECNCGKKFRNMQRYSEHYSYEHLVKGVRVFTRSRHKQDNTKKLNQR